MTAYQIEKAVGHEECCGHFSLPENTIMNSSELERNVCLHSSSTARSAGSQVGDFALMETIKSSLGGTMIGAVSILALVSMFCLDPSSKKSNFRVGLLQGFAAGCMLFLSTFHLLLESVEVVGEQAALHCFFGGILLFVLFEALLSALENKYSEGSKTSAMTLIAMALHSIPEGITVYLAVFAAMSSKSTASALQILLANGMHKIPEGMALAISIYASTKGSIFQALTGTLSCALAEPISLILLSPYLTAAASLLSNEILAQGIAAVAGFIFSISLFELLPSSVKGTKDFSVSNISLVLGMASYHAAMQMIEI